MRSWFWVSGTAALGVALGMGCIPRPKGVETNPAVQSQRAPREEFDDKISKHAEGMLEDGQRVFRYDTFGSERFWGDQLRLHEAILGEKLGGVGPGLTPRQALELGLKVDVGLLPKILVEAVKGGSVSLDDPKTTVELLRANSVVGVTGIFEGGKMKSVGIQCALCHSTVDDSFARGIGRRLDGWPNRDLNVGEVINLAPNLQPMAQALRKDEATLRRILASWGPGKYDAELNIDGKGFHPSGRSAATVIPAAFGLSGHNLHTYEGWGGVPYWNAYVANTQMHGSGTFIDPRLRSGRFPLAVSQRFYNIRNTPDLITSKLSALHFYQLSIPAPKPPSSHYDHALARQGKVIFEDKAKCATCHVPPLFSEPGWPMHKGSEIGIDDFQANRSPDRRYRTTPLAGLFVREKGGFYHDGRFKTYRALVDHYERPLRIQLNEAEKAALIEYLKSI
jgi:mono/diheme cytochrome c family protein